MGDLSLPGGRCSRLCLSFIQDDNSGFGVLVGFSSSGLLISVTGSRFGFGPSISALQNCHWGCGQLRRVCSIAPRTIGSTAHDIAGDLSGSRGAR
jgi:hypothetical protein